MKDTTKEIIKNYDHFDEDKRLTSPFGMLEAEHTRKLIGRYINAQSLDIYDIGGGTGHYSSWLAALGHRIHFSDIVPRHVEMFKGRFESSSNIISIQMQDARHLNYDNDVADLIILNGPLYHLTSRNDRLQVLKEAKRILKNNGRLLGFAISRFAGAAYALSSGEIFNDEYFEMVKDELVSGIRSNRALKNRTFISAYFHLVDELEAEFIESGFMVEHSFGVGLSWTPPDLAETVKDNQKKERLLLMAEMLEMHPMQGAKILTVGLKPGNNS